MTAITRARIAMEVVTQKRRVSVLRCSMMPAQYIR